MPSREEVERRVVRSPGFSRLPFRKFRLKAGLRTLLHKQFRDIPAGGWRRQRPAIAPGKLNPLVDDLAKLAVDLRFVCSVAAWPDDAGALSHEGLVLFGPFHDLHVAGTIGHDDFPFPVLFAFLIVPTPKCAVADWSCSETQAFTLLPERLAAKLTCR